MAVQMWVSKTFRFQNLYLWMHSPAPTVGFCATMTAWDEINSHESVSAEYHVPNPELVFQSLSIKFCFQIVFHCWFHILIWKWSTSAGKWLCFFQATEKIRQGYNCCSCSQIWFKLDKNALESFWRFHRQKGRGHLLCTRRTLCCKARQFHFLCRC